MMAIPTTRFNSLERPSVCCAPWPLSTAKNGSMKTRIKRISRRISVVACIVAHIREKVFLRD